MYAPQSSDQMEPPLDGEKGIKDVSQERIVEDGPAGAEDKAAAQSASLDALVDGGLPV